MKPRIYYSPWHKSFKCIFRGTVTGYGKTIGIAYTDWKRFNDFINSKSDVLPLGCL